MEDAGLDASDKVRLVLVNKKTHLTSPHLNGIEVREFDATFAKNGRFTVEAGGLPTWGSGYGGTEEYTLEIAVVVNGYWLKDPVSKTSNFQVKLTRE